MRIKDAKVGARVTNGRVADVERDVGTIVSTSGGVRVKWDRAGATYQEEPGELVLESEETKLAEYLAGPGGDAELERDLERAKVLRKQAGVKRTGASGGPLLGRTASGRPVHEPTGRGAPNTNDVVVFKKTKAKFTGWTKADHMDAARLLEELAATKSGGDAQRLRRWSSVHWDIGGRWTGPEYDTRMKERGSVRLGVALAIGLGGVALLFGATRGRS